MGATKGAGGKEAGGIYLYILHISTPPYPRAWYGTVFNVIHWQLTDIPTWLSHVKSWPFLA